ncbi:putative DNA polymerase sliding clamp 2 [Paramecium bursaria Chlorella virus CvsA1]|nr:putative DNA polymerase sliding clamp 2 [Paramecium bursaria Chlorella virus CvsA1]AGE55446.1 putative DNA polymerase sliding clamp 2 [Paramecium bursaria Chlorella virus MA1E]
MYIVTTSFCKIQLQMFTIVSDAAETIKKLFVVFNDLVDIANLSFTNEGLSVQSMDTSHVSLVNLKIGKSYFKDYSIAQEATVGIKISNFVRILECVGNDEITISFTYDNPDELIIKSEYSDFKMKTIDIETEEMEIPEMDIDVLIDADSNIIQKYLKNMAGFGDTVKIYTQDDVVHMKTAGEIGEVDLQIHDQRVEIKGRLTCEFATRYLMTFAKAAGISKRVVIKLLDDQPGIFEYVFDAESDSKISFFLAPKVKDDDEEY